jgi:glycosyltransferase domain-containing protein
MKTTWFEKGRFHAAPAVLNSLMSGLTIIIPSRERQKFLIRSLKYWSGRGMSIIALDGSKEPLPKQIIELLAENIKYYHLPIPLPQRLFAAVRLIETDYSVLLSDDEFFIPSALSKCIHELESNHELSATNGVVLGFRPFNSKIYGIPVYNNFVGRMRNEAFGGERMKNHMLNYTPTLSCAVARSAIWQQAALLYARREFPIFALWELYLNMTLCFAGKSKTIPELMWLRSIGETEPIRGNIPSLTARNTIYSWWNDDKNKEEKDEFVNLFTDTLKKINPDYKSSYHEAVCNAVDAYCDFYSARRGGAIYQIKRKLRPPLPPKLDQIVRNVKNIIKKSCPARPLKQCATEIFDAAKEMENQGVLVNFVELREIIDIVESFHGYPAGARNNELI